MGRWKEMVPRRRPHLLIVVAALAGLVVAAVVPAGAVGRDPGLPQQWGLRQIGAPEAWAGGAVVGAGVPIAIIDSGVEAGHEDLRSQMAASVACIDTGGDPAKCRPDTTDIDGHGTHVAGIAAAAANDVGISGVAPGARVLGIRVFQIIEDPINGSRQGAYSDDINAAIRWAIRNASRPGVINLSLGDDFPIARGNAGFDVGIEEAWAAGWLTSLAAGNEGNLFGLNSEQYGQLNALVVGATGPSDTVARYSSPTGNAKWALVAPGGDASTCDRQPDRCVLSTYKGGRYGLLQGTSMAAPHAAGAAALLMGAGRTNRQAVERLLDTANPAVACGGNCRGRLDLAKAAAGLASSPSPAPAPTSPPGTSSPASGTPSRSPATTVRPRPGPTVASPPASTAAPPPADPAEVAPVPETAPEEQPDPTAPAEEVTDLSIEEAAEVAADPPAGRDRPAPALVVAAALVAIGVTSWAGTLVWRRRRDGVGLLG